MEGSKRELRKRMIELRSTMDATYRARTDAMLTAKLMGTAMWKKARYLLLFNATFNEVSTKPLIDSALATGKKLFLPRIKNKGMDFFAVSSCDDLRPGAYGIMEPGSKVPLPDDAPYESTLCIVPALACDQEGYRLGFGGGYYDRYLSTHQMKTVTIIYDKCIIDHLPHDDHDIRLDAVLTERRFVYGQDWSK